MNHSCDKYFTFFILKLHDRLDYNKLKILRVKGLKKTKINPKKEANLRHVYFNYCN